MPSPDKPKKPRTPRRAKSVTQRVVDAKRAGWAKFVRCEADEIAVSQGCYFDEANAKRVVDFFPDLLRHSKGKFAAKPFELQDWQKYDLVYPIFGWKRADGRRRFKRTYCEVPKKNGKSTIASGLSLYLLVGDGKVGAHVFSCGASRDQARLVYDESANMVEASPELSAALQVRRSRGVILYSATKSKYEAIAAEAGIAHGKDAHAVVCDELHAWKGRDFYESMKYAGAAQENSLFIQITTAGDDMTAICYEEHERALRIISGEEVDISYYGLIYAADLLDDWTKQETWQKANPSLGITMNADDFAIDAMEAKNSPIKQAAFKRLRLNIWTGASACWLSLDAWDKCKREFSEEELEGLPAWGGIDLSRTKDLSACCWLIPQDGGYYLIERCFIPEGLIDKKEKEDKVPYRAWVNAGWLIATPGDVIDYAVVRKHIQEDAKLFAPQEIGYDPHNAEMLCNQFLRCEDGLETVPITQSMAMMGPPSSEFEKLINDQKIWHRNSPLFNWMIGGCVAYEDTNKNVRPIKRKSRARIDGVVAAIIALNRAMVGNVVAQGSYYDEHELEAF